VNNPKETTMLQRRTLLQGSLGWAVEFATGLESTDYAAIARGFGCFGETLTQVDGVAPAIARAIDSGLPAVLDCRTRFVPHPCMPAFASMNRFGFGATG
jgi:acetolactate synthase-1/2/3 large subunit